MLTKNHWITSNICEKKHSDSFIFDAYLNPYPFKEMSFDEACTYTLQEICKDHKNLYLGLSGGMDSVFILNLFHKNNIEITPIIVAYGNEQEYIHAFRICNELNITPIVLTPNAEQFLKMYHRKIYVPFDGVGYNSTQTLFCAQYVVENGGTLITANHLFGDDNELVSNTAFANITEFDFYTDHVYKECNNIDFLLYTPEIAYASLPKEINIFWGTHKANLYNIQRRPKHKHRYPSALQGALVYLVNKLEKKSYSKNWTKSEIDNIFEGMKNERL